MKKNCNRQEEDKYSNNAKRKRIPEKGVPSRKTGKINPKLTMNMVIWEEGNLTKKTKSLSLIIYLL